MKTADPLYDPLKRFVGLMILTDKRHLTGLIWIMIGVIHAGSVNLTRWLAHAETSAQQAQSTQRRFFRWLHNHRKNRTSI
jgi:hypothetical protein